MILASLVLCLSLSAFAESADEQSVTTSTIKDTTSEMNDETLSVSGVVVAVRTGGLTEVFLRGAKQSVIIPYGSGHNELLQKAVEKQRVGGSMSFTIDAKTHRVILPKKPSSSEKAGSSSEDGSSK